MNSSAPPSPSPANRGNIEEISTFKKRQASTNTRSASGFFSGVKRADSVSNSPGKITLPSAEASTSDNRLKPGLARQESSPSSNSRGARSVSRTSQQPPLDNDDTGSIFDRGDAIPTLLPDVQGQDSTPLPFLSILVLMICMFSEFLSASTPAPFIYFSQYLAINRKHIDELYRL